MKWLRITILAILLLCLVPVGSIKADTSVEITITAQGLIYFPGPPSGLTITYISDYEIGLSWTKDVDADLTLIKGAYGREVTDRDDGFEVYYGAGNYTTHWIADVGMVGPVYYKLWSQGIGGNWSLYSASGDRSFMSSSFLFLGLIALAGMFTYFSWKRRHILVSLSGSLTWLALGLWLLIGDVSNLSLADVWTKLLAWVFIMMVFFCLLTLMDTEIIKEAKNKKWVEYGKKPKDDALSSYQIYRQELQDRTRGRKRRR